MFYKIKGIQKLLNNNEITYEEFIDKCDVLVLEYDKLLHDIWKALMKLELELYEQMEEVNQTFEQSITELVNQFIESSQGYFSQIRDLEVSYAENIGDLALKFQTNATLSEEIVVPEILKPVTQYGIFVFLYFFSTYLLLNFAKQVGVPHTQKLCSS